MFLSMINICTSSYDIRIDSKTQKCNPQTRTKISCCKYTLDCLQATNIFLGLFDTLL